MKTKNIFNRLALAMLMPTMLLTTACSNEADNLINNDNNNQKGYELPVTVNVTRQSDEGTTRASFNGTTLSFSTGDKLFVRGGKSGKKFAGTLTWVSGGTFSGTITIQSGYTGNTGTADALLSDAQMPMATLLPAGYETPGYLSISNSGTYNASISSDASKAFATTKAAAVEQFSYENAMYSSGFALSPRNAILNFTITGLTASTNVTATIKKGEDVLVSGEVTTDGSGNATFAVGVEGGTDLNNLSLTVGSNAITLVNSETVLAKGKIYNITRAVAVP